MVDAAPAQGEPDDCELLVAVEGRSVMLEEYARQMIYAEELHAGEVDKMLRKPGQLAAGPALPSL